MSPDIPPSITALSDEEVARQRFLVSMGLRAPMVKAAEPDSFVDEVDPMPEEEDEIALSSRDEDFELPGVSSSTASNAAESRGRGAFGCRIERVEFASGRAMAERLDTESKPESKPESAPLLPLECPKCQGELVLKREHLGIEGACVWCGAEIVATESVADRSVRVFAIFQPGKTFREEAVAADSASQSHDFANPDPEGTASRESTSAFSEDSFETNLASTAFASEVELANGASAWELDPPVAPDPNVASEGFSPAWSIPPSDEPPGTAAPDAGFSGWAPAPARHEGLNPPPDNGSAAFDLETASVTLNITEQEQGGPAPFGIAEPMPAFPALADATEASSGFIPSVNAVESQAQPSFASEDPTPSPLESGFCIESASLDSLSGGGTFPFGEVEVSPSSGEHSPPLLAGCEVIQKPTGPAEESVSEESFSDLFTRPASKESTASFFSSPAEQAPAMASSQGPGSEALAPPPAAFAEDVRLPETGRAELEAPPATEEGQSTPEVHVESKPLSTPTRSGGPRKGLLILMMVIVGLVCGIALASFVLPVGDYVISAKSFMEALFPSASGGLSGGFALLKTGLSCAER